MALEDPITAYNAASNIDALMAQKHLESGGIEACVSEDNSLVGHWMGGSKPEIHKPQVWISCRDSKRAAELLSEFEQQRLARDPKRVENDLEPAEAHCERCDKPSTFSGTLNGTVQNCPHCGAYVDVGEFEWPDAEGFEADSAEGNE